MKIQSALSIAILAFIRPGRADTPISNSSSATDPNPNFKTTLDAQLGPYPVSIYSHEIKTSRPETLSADPNEKRRLMITIYRPFLDTYTCPVAKQSRVPFVPPVVEAALLQLLPVTNLSFDKIQVVNCTLPIPESAPSDPLILWSHGFAGTHHVYHSTLQAAASAGYTVVAIDHTYESAAVVFPNDEVIYANTTILQTSGIKATLEGLQPIRNADAVDTLDAIERGEVPGLGQFARSNSTSSSPSYSSTSSSSTSNSNSYSTIFPLRAAMYGHSIGGSTAANLLLLDPRIIGAINIDGPYFGPAENGTLTKPFLTLASGQNPAKEIIEPYYANQVRGWKSYVEFNNTVHYDFVDLPQVADLLALRGTLGPSEGDYLGTMDGTRLTQVRWRYTLDFFAFVFKGERSELLTGARAEFPDVEFLGHEEAAAVKRT